MPIAVAVVGAGGITALVKFRGKSDQMPARVPGVELRSNSSPRGAEAPKGGIGYRFTAKDEVITESNRYLRIPAVAHVSGIDKGQCLDSHCPCRRQSAAWENVSLSSLRARLTADDILLDKPLTPARSGQFDYAGRRFSVTYVSDPSVARDGVLVTIRPLE